MSDFVHVLLVAFVLGSACLPLASGGSFTVEGNNFVRDGSPFQIRSGEMHYFRSHPTTWADRLHKMHVGGLNAVQTVVPWNLHEPEEGVFVFDGFANITGFLAEAQRQQLVVILRPGPYICAEWDFGGLPYWLLRDDSQSASTGSRQRRISLRSADPLFLEKVEHFYAELLPRLAPLLYVNGGPVVMLQVENEYGSYGNDKAYTGAIRDLLRSYLGDHVILHSTDGPDERMLRGSMTAGVLPTIDFGPTTTPMDDFNVLRSLVPTGPLMNSELYTGWITQWYNSAMATGDTQAIVACVEALCRLNASFSMYMFEGGSNFGFMAGANADSDTSVQFDVTSYDYDAPLTEAGDVTDKFSAIRAAIGRFAPLPPDPVPAPAPKGAYGTVTLTEGAALRHPDTLAILSPAPVTSAYTRTFEELGVAYGFVLYRTTVARPAGTLTLQRLRDRALVFLDDKYVTALDRASSSVAIAPTSLAAQLDLLVENQGRVNYGPFMCDPKGVLDGVRIDNQFQFNFTTFPLPLAADQLGALDWHALPLPAALQAAGPMLYHGTFSIESTPLDTWIDMSGWSKGAVWVNGFHLGRFWSVGPQLSLYTPAAVLRGGAGAVNELVVLELAPAAAAAAQPTVTLRSAPVFTPPSRAASNSDSRARARGPRREPAPAPAVAPDVTHSTHHRRHVHPRAPAVHG